MHSPSPLRQIAVLILCLAAVPAMADIYKYVDKNGVVTYTNRKPTRGSYEGHLKVMFRSCLLSYLGCNADHWDWRNVPLNVTAFAKHVRRAAARQHVDPALLRAVIHAESAFHTNAISRAGAEGLMQLMPATQRRFGVNDPFDPGQNIRAGARYLRKLLDMFNGNVRLAAAAYNAGENAVKKYNGVPPYNETRNYVKRVSILYSRYKAYN